MKKALKKLLCITLCMACLLASGCSAVSNETPGFSLPQGDVTSPPPDEIPSEEITTLADIPIEVPDISANDYSAVYQAELGNLTSKMEIGTTREGYTGDGYVTGFARNSEEHWSMDIEITSSQHYDISLFVSSDSPKNNRLYIDGEFVGEIITKGSDGFEKVTLENIFLPQGVSRFEIIEVTAAIAFDKIEIDANLSSSAITFEATATPINENANEKTKNTLKYLTDIYGEKLLSGQFASIGANVEPEKLHILTGRYPALRLGDMYSYTIEADPSVIGDTTIAKQWSDMGGIVSYMWHWAAPMHGLSCYSDVTGFDLALAMTDKDIATKSFDELQVMFTNGEISEECLALIHDIDVISKEFSYLQDENVTILWRPLHEASGGWFWWGSAGKEAYLWLWDLMYERMTYHHNLNNLLWIWNAQSESWYVGDDKCDIISVDIYKDGDFSSQLSTFISLQSISQNKLIALSECSNPVLPELSVRDRAMWAWFCVWGGSYIMDEAGELTDAYTTPEQWIDIYSSQAVITLEELPDLS